MFSKAKRFEPIVPSKTQSKSGLRVEKEISEKSSTGTSSNPKSKQCHTTTTCISKSNIDTLSQRSSVPSVKSFATPKPIKPNNAITNSAKKVLSHSKNTKLTQKGNQIQEDVLKAQEVEIRNKDQTIAEYNKQIEDLKKELAAFKKNPNKLKVDCNSLSNKFKEINLNKDKNKKFDKTCQVTIMDNQIEELNKCIIAFEKQCDKLEAEVSNKQVELSSLEEIIIIRDSLCKDLQDKLSSMESSLDETKQRLEMVKGHHALALEANESIRREYKLELETLKNKMEEEKVSIINKNKADQETLKTKYDEIIETIKTQMLEEKDNIIHELQDELDIKDREFKAKMDQINEATHEKLRLCEIQFEERTSTIQDHWSQQQSKLQYLEKETKDLKYSLTLTEEQKIQLQRELNKLRSDNESLKMERNEIMAEMDEFREKSKKRIIDFENEINKLTVQIEKAAKEKSRFEMSLSVTRDIVQVLTMRLRESDSEIDHMEKTVQTLTSTKESLENELETYKTKLNTIVLECNEYKDALVNILKSKAALAKEHNRIMEHNVTLIESLQNVEKEAYRELGSIKNEMIEDVELIKKESNSQIKQLRDEVEKKRMLCELATEHAGQAAAAAEQSRALLAQAAAEVARLEADNDRYQQQIEDQQSLVVELSLLRQENEELTMTVAKQSSLIDKMKKDFEVQSKPKSPSVVRKTHKIGKENIQAVISPLRERNH